MLNFVCKPCIDNCVSCDENYENKCTNCNNEDKNTKYILYEDTNGDHLCLS